MSAPVGSARGDLSIYDGRVLLGTIRGSIAGCYAYDPAGKAIGNFADQKAAKAALLRAAGKAVAP